MTYDEFLCHYQRTLVGYYLLHKWFPGQSTLQTPYPPAELSDDDADALKDRLSRCIPRDSTITDLWDWDVHFEELLGEDWYFEAAFGPPDSVDESAKELAGFFLEQVDELGIDYNQHENPDVFRNMINEEARRFIQSWRQNIFKMLVQGDSAQKANP